MPNKRFIQVVDGNGKKLYAGEDKRYYSDDYPKEKKGFSFEGINISLKLVVIVLCSIGWQYYQNDQKVIKDALNNIQIAQSQAISDLKSSNKTIWETLTQFKDDTNNKFIYIYQHLK